MRASASRSSASPRTAWGVETIGSVRPGERLKAGDYEVRLERVIPRVEANYRDDVAILTVFGAGRELGDHRDDRSGST